MNSSNLFYHYFEETVNIFFAFNDKCISNSRSK